MSMYSVADYRPLIPNLTSMSRTPALMACTSNRAVLPTFRCLANFSGVDRVEMVERPSRGIGTLIYARRQEAHAAVTAQASKGGGSGNERQPNPSDDRPNWEGAAVVAPATRNYTQSCPADWTRNMGARKRYFVPDRIILRGCGGRKSRFSGSWVTIITLCICMWCERLGRKLSRVPLVPMVGRPTCGRRRCR